MNLEHSNITVSSIDETSRFLTIAFPEVQVRGGGARQGGGKWCHIGTNRSYVALQQEGSPQSSNRVAYVQNGINHLGFVVEDVAAVNERLTTAGYTINPMGVEEEGRTSIYVYDKDGIEWEFIQYHSENNLIRNNY